MKIQNEHIKIILGLKIKQWRLSKGLSLKELALQTGLSVSYLNEIESGKKYPKTDKLASLAEALDVNYDKMVSLKLSKNLAPIGDLLESKLLKQLPLHHYGIDINKLIALMAEAPMQLSALVSTIIELARSSELSQNNFSRTALQTYKEFNENHFENIEEAAKNFVKFFKLKTSPPLKYKELAEILVNKFNYEIDETRLSNHKELKALRGIVFNEKNKILLLNKNLEDSQKAFVIGKELGYNFLKLEDRSYVYSTLALDSFDQLLNNFQSSYFANALILNARHFVKDLREFFNQTRFNKSFLLNLISKYNSTPEMFFQRMTNLLAKNFGLNKFFFLRFNSLVNIEQYKLSKELRLNITRNPGGYEETEHYCRRWVSVQILKEMKTRIKKNPDFKRNLGNALRSKFVGAEDCFLNISVARRRILLPNELYSVTIGFYSDENLHKTIKFWNDTKIPFRIVSDTCEMCPINDCIERAAPPISLEKLQDRNNLVEAINKLKREVLSD